VDHEINGNFHLKLKVCKRKAPPESVASCHPRGWTQTGFFIVWMNHFVHCVKPTKQRPVVLLLDEYSSHIKNASAIDIGRENGRAMCVPPHCTRKMQSPDVGRHGCRMAKRVSSLNLDRQYFRDSKYSGSDLENRSSEFTKTEICPPPPTPEFLAVQNFLHPKQH
jgi:hypothetical protein